VDERADGPTEGAGLVNLAFAGTGVVAGTSAAAALVPDTFGIVHAVVSCALFAVGTGAFLWAYALGVSRSRDEAVDIPGLFFLTGDTAPREVRRPFRVALAVEVVAVVTAAALRPYTEVAFGILAPMFAMGLMGTWGGRHGRFPPKAARPAAPEPSAPAADPVPSEESNR
jgi:hypothetical protein